jgi:uncharacterized surface anchored protein
VTETLPVTNLAFTDLSCVASGSGTSATPSSGNATLTATITLGFGGAVTCTYTNQQQLGAIKITKTSSKAAHTPLSGAKFSISSGGTPIAGSPFTTDANGVICVDHLPFGTYSVQETSAPAGYDIDDTAAHDVMVNTASTCGDGHEATFSATDTPLTDIPASATSEVAGGTQSTVTCTGTSTDGKTTLNSSDRPKESAGVSATKLHPGTYTCTLVIDP